MGFGKDGKGVIIRQDISQAIGTLAAGAGLIITANLATLERFRMLKSEIIATIEGATAGELQGMGLYLVDGDLALSEFVASLTAAGPLGPNDAVVAAAAERFSVYAGMVHLTAGEERIFLNETGGAMLEVKPRWTFSRTKSWNWVLFNHGVAPTTGATVKVKAKSFGVWVT